MNEQFRVTNRPQAQQAKGGTPQAGVFARPGSYTSAMPAPDADLQGLVQGLSKLNPSLMQYGEAVMEENQNQARRLAAAEVQRPADPAAALNGGDVAVPLSVPPALSPAYTEHVRMGLSQRTGQRVKADMVAAYDEASKSPDFNLDGWLAEQRSSALKGIQDPTSVGIIGSHVTELEGHLRSDYERKRMKRLEETNNSVLFQDAADRFTADLTPDGVAEAFSSFEGKARGLGMSSKEAVQFLFAQLSSNSAKMGGTPDAFDAFDKPLAGGKTLRALNPELSGAIDAAKAQAQALYDKRSTEAAQVDNGKFLDGVQKLIDSEPEKVTPELLIPQFTKYGAIQSPQQYASLLNAARDAQMRRQAVTAYDPMADAGELFRLPSKTQQDILNRRLNGDMTGMLNEVRQANPQGAAEAMGALVTRTLQWGADVPFEQLKGFVTTNFSTVPSQEGPGAGFEALSTMYRALSNSPQLRTAYFPEDAASVMEAYQAARNNGSDPKAAYDAAYKTIDPVAKKAAEEYAKTPAFQKLVDGDVKKYVEGSSFWPRWLGGAGRPTNEGHLTAAARMEIMAFRSRNPFAGDDRMEGHLESWFKRNYVLDRTSQTAIKVPPGLSGPAAQEAISDFSAKVTKDHELGSRSDGKWTVEWVPMGTEGRYSVVLFNGSATQRLPGQVDLQQLVAAQQARKVLSEAERQQLGAYRAGSTAPLPPELLAKAEALKVLSPQEVKRWKDAQASQALERVSSVPQMTFGKPSGVSLQFANSAARIDTQATAEVAMRLLGGPMAYTLAPKDGAYRSYAASLVAVGEGVALRAYDDPARGAGKNIGMGYNLDANKATATADLKAAGVPESMIPSVMAGTVELTTAQAERLLHVALPRYEKQVHDVAEATAPKLWDRMTPAQRAVMVDIAYQAGDPGKFKKAWAALAAGDQETFAAETKVFYTNRKGELVEDTRRGKLRASMLAGPAYWDQAIQELSRTPGNKLQAMNLK